MILKVSLRSRYEAGRRLFLPLGVLLLACISSCAPFDRRHPPLAAGGTLDLRGWDFVRDGHVELQGEWDFFPGKLLREGEIDPSMSLTRRHVPDLWKGGDAGGRDGRGAGTYRLKVLLPSSMDKLGIRYSTTSTSFELDANGIPVASAGKPDIDPKKAIAAYRPGVKPLPPTGTTLELLVRISNHEYRSGGMWISFSLGGAEAMANRKRAKDGLSFMLFGVITAMALYSLVVFPFRRKDRNYLLFAAFAPSIALRTLITGEYILTQLFPGIPFDAVVRIEYLSAFSMAPLAILFFTSLFPDEMGRKGRIALVVPTVPFFALLLLAPLPVLTRSIFVYYIYVWIALIIVFGFVIIRATARNRPGARLMLAGSLLLVIAGINDTLFSSFVIYTGNFIPTALAVFVVLQAVVLAQRFSSALNRAEALSGSLREVNKRLTEEVDRYAIAQQRLESFLAEKEILIKEVHHRVKNSLQIVSSIISLQSHRAKDPALLEAYASMKNRIKAVSMVHERLYNLNVGEKVDLGGYVSDLVAHFARGYGSGNETVDISAETASVEVSMEFCVDFGLMLNELVTNSYRHAVIPRGGGTIKVILRHEGDHVVLEVDDDGPGFPERFDPEKSSSLGFKITSILAKKRSGNMDFPLGKGGRISVRLKLDQETEQKNEEK